MKLFTDTAMQPKIGQFKNAGRERDYLCTLVPASFQVDGSSNAERRGCGRLPSELDDGEVVTEDVECRLTTLDKPHRRSVERRLWLRVTADCVTTPRWGVGGGRVDSLPTDVVVAVSSHVTCGISPLPTLGGVT